jgi:hypothetical protein
LKTKNNSIVKKRRLTYNDYQKYLDDAMSAEKRHEFEKRMMQDAFDEEAFDGLQQLSGEQVSSDVSQLKKRIEHLNQKKKRVIPFWFRYAAAAVIIIGIGVVSILYFNSNPKYDLDYSSTAGQSFAIADTTGKSIQKEDVTSVAPPPTTLNDEVKKQEITKEEVEPTEKPVEITVEEIEPTEAPVEITLEDFDKEEEVPEPIIADEKAEIEAIPEKQSGATRDNTLNAISGNALEPAAKAATTMKKSRSRERLASEEMAQPATAPKTVTYRAMPPIGLDYVQFRKQLVEEMAKILAQHNEEAAELTLTIAIDETGVVTEVRTKESLKRKTAKAIEQHIKGLGNWKPELENGIAKESEEVITLNFE